MIETGDRRVCGYAFNMLAVHSRLALGMLQYYNTKSNPKHLGFESVVSLEVVDFG